MANSRNWLYTSTLVGFLGTILLVGCSSELPDPSTGSGAPSVTAEFADDPMVNPESLFDPMPPDSSGVDTEATLRRTIDGNPAQLNPIFSSSLYEQSLDQLLFDTLFVFDRNMEWSVNDGMIESLDRSADDKNWKIKLKPGLKWNDGQPFTAHDVQFSWEVILDERVPVSAVRNGTDQIVRIEAIDDLTLELDHKEARPTNIWNALFPIIPKHIFEKDRAANPDMKSGDYNNRHNREIIVSNGPFKLVEWVENEKIVLERWDDFHGEKPAFERLICRIVPDRNVQMLSFIKGDLDEFRMTDEQFARQSGRDSEFATRGAKILASQWAYSYIGWNQDGSNPFFNDKRVRQAMAHAFDTETILRDVTYNLQTPCYGIFHPEAKWFSPAVEKAHITFDLTKAAALLDEAGWTVDREQGGYRYKDIDGTPTRFEFTCLVPQGATTSEKILAIFQNDLKSIGVGLKTRTMEWASFIEQVRKHNFQAEIAAWGTGTDPDTLWNLWHSSSYTPDGSQGRNYGKFSNARVDELFELGRRELDADKRLQYYKEIGEIIYEEQPYLFISNRGTTWGIDKRMHGVQTSPRGLFSFSPAESAWWIPASP